MKKNDASEKKKRIIVYENGDTYISRIRMSRNNFTAISATYTIARKRENKKAKNKIKIYIHARHHTIQLLDATVYFTILRRASLEYGISFVCRLRFSVISFIVIAQTRAFLFV